MSRQTNEVKNKDADSQTIREWIPLQTIEKIKKRAIIYLMFINLQLT